MNQPNSETSLGQSTSPLVLVVDDDEAIREALADLLDDAGFDTLAAPNGFEALKILAGLDRPPTFILLDLMMPVMDGWTFCSTRRKSRAFREIPVIALSALEVSESERPVGVDAFLPKPIDLDQFARLAARLSGRAASRPRQLRLLH